MRNKSRSKKKQSAQRASDPGLRRIWGVMLILLALFLGLSLWSYDWRDIAVLQYPPNSPPCNWFGVVGAWVSLALFLGFGIGTYFIPALCAVFGVVCLLHRGDRLWPRAAWGGVWLLSLLVVLELQSPRWAATCRELNLVDAGGILGRLIGTALLVRLLSPIGTGIIGSAFLLVSSAMLIGPAAFVALGRGAARWHGVATERARAWQSAREEREGQRNTEGREREKQRRRLEKKLRQQEKAAGPMPLKRPSLDEPVPELEPAPEPAPEAEPEATSPPKKKPAAKAKPDDMPMFEGSGPDGRYEVPPFALLHPPPATRIKASTSDIHRTAELLQATLAEFGIEAEVTNVERGPVVTSYELLPAPGVRVERIQGLSNNLALSLKATSVRVQAPIPGKGVVGIEVPNATANFVYIRELLQGDRWQSGRARLPLALGKDVSGKDIIGDLTEMPHLLIAGATGSGKTVCMNSVLAGLLMSRTPDELRLMLVDPKIVEFSAYNHLPHLVVPVITDPKKVALGLRWAINEMESRYKLFAKVGVRNIESYNKREVATQTSLFEEEPEPEKNDAPARLPYVVIVIDELADLMLVAQADIENCVARLAQLSRAVGIHMIIATQRPSVNVITGTIKANFPARIAFQVAQKVDSRTILDTGGAEKLLGKGDMLYQPPGSNKMARAQGAMTTDAEIRAIVEHIKKQAEPSYEVEIHQRMEKGGASRLDQGEDDELLGPAIEIIKETHRASTSSLQRRLRIGYTRAARIMDILEERGVIGPPRGSDPREILIDLDGDIPNNSPDRVVDEAGDDSEDDEDRNE